MAGYFLYNYLKIELASVARILEMELLFSTTLNLKRATRFNNLVPYSEFQDNDIGLPLKY
jgi:hypothetical protein